MKDFFKHVVITMIICTMLIDSLIWAVTVQKRHGSDFSFQSIVSDKYRDLNNSHERKIIMVAGSSSAFGLDVNMLEEETGYDVVNLGLHAGFGYLFYSELAEGIINPGDIVLLGYEYEWIHEFDSTELNSKAAFDPGTLQMTWCRDYAMSDYYDNLSLYGTTTVVDSDGTVTISDSSITYLKDFKACTEERGANVYFVAPPVLYDSITCDVDAFVSLAKLEEELIGIPYISDPRMYMFPIDLMSDSIYHCNSEGARMRTSLLIDDLRVCGAIESPALTSNIQTKNGEPFVLSDTLPNRFLNKPVAINNVYHINGDGTIAYYSEGADYIVDYDHGTISRTEDSNITNYMEHYVSYSEGKFAWINDNENQNPESNVTYQVFVDYDYYAYAGEYDCIADNSYYLSDSTRDKINNGEVINISLIGDSIGAGSDTMGQGIFLDFLKESLESYYGITVNTKNYSVGGRTSDLLSERLDEVLADHPDIVLVEFGMNDHCGSDAMSDDRLNAFETNIEAFVSIMKDNNIDVVLIGFFQQNMTWTEENMDATIKYNDKLREIAQNNNLFFADVYSLFNEIGGKKPLSRNVFADYIHHPNSWGHRLYLTSLISLFNVDGNMRPIDIAYYEYSC